MRVRAACDCMALNDADDPDADLFAACREAIAAAEVYESAVRLDPAADSPELRAVVLRERTALDYVMSTPAKSAVGLAAKTALLLRWADRCHGASLALAIAKDAIAVADQLLAMDAR